tara:strand:+ start:17280 stop:18677 length:1398 start_codon:yes stop_codon:yes gene_type:complete
MIKRYFATKDNTITNAFEENLVTRGTGSNMGASDILEVFSIYGQESSASAELARSLIEFDTTELQADRDALSVPVSGGVSWYLKMYNAPHSQTVPSGFTLSISAVSSSWEEGYGMDMETYQDITNDNIGSNWVNSASGTAWVAPGGDYHATLATTQTFSTGLEDLEVDVSDIVEKWLASVSPWTNSGFGVKLTDALEVEAKSFFTKKFFGKDTEFHFQKPVLEARWDSSRKDDRGSFYASSSIVSAGDNLNTLYLYNRIRGTLRDFPIIPTSASIRYTSDGAVVAESAITKVSTGVYTAQIAADVTSSSVFDVWYSGSVAYHTGTIAVKSFQSYGYNPEEEYVLSMPGLKKEYRKNQVHRLNLYVREANWSPNIYTVAVQSSIPSLVIESGSYQLRRSVDDLVTIPYGTGSTLHTVLSYDVSGNYFDLDTSYLEEGYLYEAQYSFHDETNGWQEQPFRFKFRVVD